MSDHYLTVHFETGDQEYLTLQCGLTGPDRPCAVITCPVDHEDASRSCIAEHGATPLDECWAESWFEHGGREAINTEDLEPVTIPVTVEYDTGVLVHDILPCPPAPEVERWQEALDRARDACACCGDPIDRTGIPDHHHVTYCTDCLAASCSEYPGECGKVPRSKVEIAKVKGLVPITREEQSAVDRIADPGREMTDEILSDEAELARTREALRHVREGDVVPWTRPSDPGLPDPSGPVA